VVSKSICYYVEKMFHLLCSTSSERGSHENRMNAFCMAVKSSAAAAAAATSFVLGIIVDDSLSARNKAAHIDRHLNGANTCLLQSTQQNSPEQFGGSTKTVFTS